PLGQRRRDSGNNSAARHVGQSLQRDERTSDRFCPWADIGTPIAPLAPAALGLVQHSQWVDRRRRPLKRESVGQDKRNGVSRLDREFTERSQILAIESGRRAQQ